MPLGMAMAVRGYCGQIERGQIVTNESHRLHLPARWALPTYEATAETGCSPHRRRVSWIFVHVDASPSIANANPGP